MTATARILVVDDEEHIVSLFRDVLGKAGYSVTGATSAEEALLVAKVEDFDIVFADIKMPERDGFAFRGDLRQLGKEVPVIAITGYADGLSTAELKKQGFYEVVRKPFDIRALAELVETILSKDQTQPS